MATTNTSSLKPSQLVLDPQKRIPLLKDHHHHHHDGHELTLPIGKSHTRPGDSQGGENGSVYFIGTATTVIEWQGIRILTDPNFLHAGDHVHLGPGVTAERLTNPAVNLDQLPPLDCILLSHYHADHFDQLVEASLNRQFPIISTPHAKQALTSKDDPFQAVYDLDFFETLLLPIAPGPLTDTFKPSPTIKVTGMPGKHVPPGPLSAINDFLHAVPPTNGWLIELGHAAGAPADMQTGYRIYISGDTLVVDELKAIPTWLQYHKVDLMLVHLGGTTVPGPGMPLLMITMDGKQGVQLMRLVDPDVTVPIHFDDYSVFLSPLADFKAEVEGAGFGERVVYLDRGDEYRFRVRGGE